MADRDAFLQAHSRDPDVNVASIADNCRFEERASPARWAVLDDVIAGRGGHAGPGNWDDWLDGAELYYQQRCAVARSEVPEAFADANSAAWLTGIEENQTLVRVENLGRALGDAGYTLDELSEFHARSQAGDNDAAMAVREFVDILNLRRDARPAFAAFYDEVRDEAESDDWPHELRDRLGLGHYPVTHGASVPVAMMTYSAADVLREARRQSLPAACAVPTVLDGGMHAYYFPSPRQQPFGATMHLCLDHAEILTAEVLHCRIDYSPGHIRRIGRITQDHGLGGSSLRDARDWHLVALQVASARDDFGELFEGRA